MSPVFCGAVTATGDDSYFYRNLTVAKQSVERESILLHFLCAKVCRVLGYTSVLIALKLVQATLTKSQCEQPAFSNAHFTI